MSEEKKETQERYEAKLKAEYSHVARVTLTSGLHCYFRRPTDEEHGSYQNLVVGGSEQEKDIAYRRYVSACYLGSFPQGTSFEAAVKLEGPGVVSSSFGRAVNDLAGTGARPTKRL
jgi:hypothetical protein